VRDNGPTARLALASALARAGRGDDALAVLWPARADARVRSELAQFPAYDHPPLGPVGWIDTPPLRSAPRVRWRRSFASPERPWQGVTRRVLAASPLGVLAHAHEDAAPVALDPDTGDVRWRLPGVREWRPRVQGELVVATEDGRRTVRDLSTGDERADLPWPEVVEPDRSADQWQLACGPTFRVVARMRPETRWFDVLVVGPAGERVIADRVYDFGAVAAAREVIYSFFWQLPAGFSVDAPAESVGRIRLLLSAHDVAGERLWSLSEQDLGTGLLALAPLAGRLYALGQDASVLCLEASDAASMA
jgi:hypothetical protein